MGFEDVNFKNCGEIWCLRNAFRKQIVLYFFGTMFKLNTDHLLKDLRGKKVKMKGLLMF